MTRFGIILMAFGLGIAVCSAVPAGKKLFAERHVSDSERCAPGRLPYRENGRFLCWDPATAKPGKDLGNVYEPRR